jgi:hypothetical protein
MLISVDVSKVPQSVFSQITYSSSVFARSGFRISARRSAVSTADFLCLLQFLQASPDIVPQVKPLPLPSTTFPIHYSLIIHSTLCKQGY